MTMIFADRADQLCDRLREIEHQAEKGDQLFYCAYLLGLLGLYSSTEGENEFDHFFTAVLKEALEAENVVEVDQKHILVLWETVCKSAG